MTERRGLIRGCVGKGGSAGKPCLSVSMVFAARKKVVREN